MNIYNETLRLIIRPVKLICYYFIYQVVCTFLATFVMTAYSKAYPMESNTLNTYAMALGLFLSGILMIVHLLVFKYITIDKENRSKVSLKTILISLPLILSALISSNIANEFIRLPNIYEGLFYNMSRNIFGLLSMALVAPIVEEMLFRGAIEGFFLKQQVKPSTAIMVSALIFGLIHVNPAQVLFAFFLGIVFGWLYYRTRSILPGMVAHLLNNIVAAIAMATSSVEEMDKTTAETIGLVPTIILLVAGILVLITSYIYLNKVLPGAKTTIATKTVE